MKQSIFSTVFFLCCFFTTQAQLGLHLSAGINTSTVEYQKLDFLDADYRTGYFIGVAPSYRISNKLQLLANIQYSQKGTVTEYIDNLTSDIESRYIYLDLIPEIELRLLPFITVGLGLNYGVLINEEDKINDTWTTPDVELENKTDLGLAGKVKFTFNHLFCFARYNFGLSNLNDTVWTDANGQEIEDSKEYNRNIQIGVGYSFGGGN